MKFRIGDKVRIINNDCNHNFKIGEIVTIEIFGYNDYKARGKDNYWWIKDSTAELVTGFKVGDKVKVVKSGSSSASKLELIERKQMKTLRERIEALNDGWNKEADDILNELSKNNDYAIYIPMRNGDSGSIKVSRRGDSDDLFYSEYKGQCQKMIAFKKTLLWLLEKSGLEGAKQGDTAKVEVEGVMWKATLIEKI